MVVFLATQTHFCSASFLHFLTASRVARNAKLGEEQPLAESVKRGGACLCAVDRLTVTRAKAIPPFNFASRATHRGIG